MPGVSKVDAAALLLGLAIGAREWHWVDAGKVQDGKGRAKGSGMCGEFCGFVSKNQWSEGPNCPRCQELARGREPVKQGSLW